ncbi:TIM barrel protein [Cyclobacteriaceae bacterium]|jgi:hydroxypyruvate isomerase|nr:TIM barrel protein [Cyclobacteriaceae bacterium]
MSRRTFLKNSIAATALPLFGFQSIDRNRLEGVNNSPFNLNYAPHFGMFKSHSGEDLISQLDFMAEYGFKSFEDNEMRMRPKATQNQIAETLIKNGMTMGVFVGHKIYWDQPNLTSGNEDLRNEFLADIRSSIEVAKRVNAKWMTVVPGYVDLKLQEGYQTAHLIEALRRACDLLEPEGLVMVLEPLNPRDHAGQFLSKIPQAYEICRAVDSPSCKILFDIYHQQITEGNIIPNIDNSWSEIAYFQIGDNPGRKEPTTGELNYQNIFEHIHAKGYQGILGMEHGNSEAGKRGELAVIAAYRKVDNFL